MVYLVSWTAVCYVTVITLIIKKVGVVRPNFWGGGPDPPTPSVVAPLLVAGDLSRATISNTAHITHDVNHNDPKSCRTYRYHFYRTRWMAVNCGMFCFWHCQSAVSLFVYIIYLGNRWTNLRQIHTKDVFGPSLGRVWRSRSRSPGTNTAFLALSAACVRFMFGKTSLASS